MKILIADDSPIFRRLVEAALNKRGYETITVSDGIDAFNALSMPDAPPLAILDVNMPGMNGIEVCRRVREEPRILPAYIILLTGNQTKADLIAGLQGGADDYVTKPFDAEELCARLQVGLRVVELQRRTAEHVRLLEDVSAGLKLKSEALALSEERFRNIIEEMADGYWETDLTGSFTFLNDPVVKSFGRPREELMGLNNREYMSKETASRVLSVFNRVYQTGEPAICLFHETIRGDGTAYYAESNVSLIRDSAGRPVGFRGISRDVTERKRAEDSLRRSEEKYRSLIANIPDVTWTADSQGNVSFISPNVERVLGFTAEEIYEKPRSHWLGRIRAEDQEMVKEAIDGLFFQYSSYDVSYRVRRKDEEWAWIHDRSITTYDKDGVRCADGVMSDITERKRVEEALRESEEQLLRAQKMLSIGQLAAGIAHEINTPMQYLGDNIRFLQDSFSERSAILEAHKKLLEACRDEGVFPDLVAEAESTLAAADVEYHNVEIPKALQQSLEGVERVSGIVQSMKDFAHPGIEKKAADLNKAIESTLTVARNEWKYVADLVTEFDPSLPLVPCLLGELNQVVLNMIINAAHAIADVVGDGSQGKGTITVSTRHADGWAEVRIADTGTGIPEKIRSRIFDPFFTTKEVGRGTGQGLAISHAVVVKKHGGTVDFETEVGRGTTFIVRLPVNGNHWAEAAANGGPR
ncbi:MAG: PAS domain S-box protein [Blastocatellia bacterium]